MGNIGIHGKGGIWDCEKKSVNKVIHFRTSMIMTGERLENKLFALFYV